MNRLLNHILLLTGLSLLGSPFFTYAQDCNGRDGKNLVGIDQFGRTFGTVGGFREDRAVGMFYWLWIGQAKQKEVYDASKIVASQDGIDKLAFRDCPESPDHGAHYWGEPLWGYYNSTDIWVIRKQMQMLTLAGVDFIFFDHTNCYLFEDNVFKVCKVIQEMTEQGWKAPKVVSYLHSRSFDTLRRLYSDIYKSGKYPDVWYRIDGKPLVIAYTDPADDLAEAATRADSSYVPGKLSEEILDYFHFFKPNWPFDPTYPDGFTWVEWSFPQPYHSESRMMNVTVASHPGCPMSYSLTRPGWINWGRGWNPELQKNVQEDVDRGTFFQRQWDEALKVDPAIIAVGGWNEWIAYKTLWDGEYKLVDAASKEFSRDIEPMKGGYEDAFYLQLIANIRAYKGINNCSVRGNNPVSIDIDGPLSLWDSVRFREFHPDARQAARNSVGGAKSVRYRTPAPENALSEVRVCHDDENIYFYIACLRDWKAPKRGERSWLNIYIGTGTPSAKGWEGYEFLLGERTSGGTLSLDSVGPGRSLNAVGELRYVLQDKCLQIAVPRRLVGLCSCNGFYFKLAAGTQDPSDIMSTYTSGSALPMGRLSYQYFF